MKKYSTFLSTVLILSGLLLSSSCDKDDPKPQPTTKQLLLGKWFFVESSHPAEPGMPPLNECDQKSYWLFDDAGMLKGEYYEKDDADGSCDLDYSENIEYILTADDEILLPNPKGGGKLITTRIESISASELIVQTYYGTRIRLKKASN